MNLVLFSFGYAKWSDTRLFGKHSQNESTFIDSRSLSTYHPPHKIASPRPRNAWGGWPSEFNFTVGGDTHERIEGSHGAIS